MFKIQLIKPTYSDGAACYYIVVNIIFIIDIDYKYYIFLFYSFIVFYFFIFYI